MTEGRRRLTGAEARQRLLAAGAERFYRDPVRSGLDRIRVQDVVGDLGLTSGAFYNLWDNLDAYRADLLAYLTDNERFPTVSLVLAESLAAVKDRPFPEAVAALAGQAWVGVTEGPGPLRAFLALWLLEEPSVTSSLQAQYDFQTRSWSTVLELGLPIFGRRPRTGWTTTQQAVVMTALIEGCFLRWSLDPGAMATEDRSLFVDAMVEFLVATTEPAVPNPPNG